MDILHIPPTLREALKCMSTFLQNNDSDAPLLVAQMLTMHVLQVDKIYLITQGQSTLSPSQWQNLVILSQRHAEGEPLAYILGNKEFYGRDFAVNKATLIPRPESEDVLDAVMHLARKIPQYTLPADRLLFADIGTGSGCLACTFAAEIPYAHGFMVDISPEALHTAWHNASQHHVHDRLQLLQGSLYTLPFAPNSLDVVISNPPYISEAEFQSLDKNVRDFEPKTALVPVTTTQDLEGLAHLEALARQTWPLLRQGGLCVVEHGCTQGAAVRELFKQHGSWKSVQTGQDLAGHDRYCLCEK